MKILSIHFKNINSLRGEHEIAFDEEPLKTAGLFAITGSTGSGKTTLLDVISLALFLQIPRYPDKITKRIIENTGAILTQNTKEAFAAVKYECSKGIFVSKWSISTNRNEKLRDYDMELSDYSTGEFLDIKKSDIPKKNEELIGLNYDQFIKSILLAQGEFSKFLKSKKDKRGELLEKITGSQIYREIGRKAYEKYRSLGKVVDELKQRETILKEEQMEEEEFHLLQTRIQEYIDQQKQFSLQLENTKKQITTKTEIAGLQKSIRDEKSKNEELQERKKKFENQYASSLKKHEELLPISDKLSSWKQQQTEIEKVENRVQSIKKEEVENESYVQTSIQQISTFIHTQVTEINLIDELSFFQDKVEKGIAEKKEIENEFRSIISQATIFARKLQINIIPKELDDCIETTIELKNQLEVEFTRIRKLLADEKLKDVPLSIEQNQLKIQHLLVAKEKLRSTQKLKVEQQKATLELDQFSKKLEAIPHEIEKTAKDYEISDLKLKNLIHEQNFSNLSKSLEEHRHTLVDNEPCPLCGALDHPFKDHFPIPEQKEDIEQQIKVCSTERDSLNAKLSKLQQEKEQISESISDLKVRLEEFKKEINSIEETLQKISQLKDNTDIEALVSSIKTENAQLEKWQSLLEKEAMIKELSPLLEKLIELRNEGQEKRNEILKIYAGEDIRSEVENFKTKWNQLMQKREFIIRQLKDQRENIQEASKNLTLLSEAIAPLLSKLHYSSPLEALENKLSEQAFNQLIDQRNKLTSSIHQVIDKIKIFEDQLKQRIGKDSAKSIEQLNIEANEIQQQLSRIQNELIAQQSSFKRQNDIRDQIQLLRVKMEEELKINKKWLLLNQYIGDAEGKKFSTFAQELTLNQLVILANKRLKGLSDRYLIDVPNEEEDESLIVIDEHMGNIRRSVKTLSGGESFLMSLSLALALSDLASRNVEIKSLFIDEGFGTLDPETLDQTLDTLEKLQAESNKTIGVISHVNALKERITTQIQISKNGQGNSSISIAH